MQSTCELVEEKKKPQRYPGVTKNWLRFRLPEETKVVFEHAKEQR